MENRKRALRWRIHVGLRQWHIWLGLALTPLLILVSLTGIWLNHKELFSGGQPSPAPTRKNLLNTGTHAGDLPLSLDDALRTARYEMGWLSLDSVELAEARGRLVYRVVPTAGRELVMDAHSGAWRFEERRRSRGPHAGAPSKRSLNRLMRDLHTGDVAGMPGRLFIDFSGVVLVGLCLSGLYLWVLPRWNKRRAAGKS